MATMPVEEGFYITSPFGQRSGEYAGMHWGTDFGHDGGSGGYPIFATKDGTVQYAGPASGFGQWVTIDHPSENGGGYSVYGHVIPEVSPGQPVREGQRIGRINPDPNSNGGVAPHLHYEFHRYTWAQPGGDRLDPLATVLNGAVWPGQTPAPREEERMGTIFGVDVSEHQDGMSLVQAKNEGIDFCIVRTTDGTYRDRCYRSHVDDARQAGMVLAAYHYLRNPSEGTSIRQQVDASLDVMGGDHRLPMWLDCETDAGLHPDHIRECKRLFEEAGIRVVGVYSYIPWWEGRVVGGEPDTHEFGAVWLAAYGQNPTGPPRAIYPGDQADKWNYPLGNQLPAIWQYGSAGLVAGREVDINAFRGSVEQLQALFYSGTVPQGGNTMSLFGHEQVAALNDAKIAAQEANQKLDHLISLMEYVAGQLGPWPQLGQNSKGENLTLVDGVAAARRDIANIQQQIQIILKGK